MKRRALTRTAALAGAALLALTAPALAYAATGTFQYVLPDGASASLVNPDDERCYNIDTYGPIDNATNRYAVLYPSTACRGNTNTLTPGQYAPHLDARSVRFTAKAPQR
ncbi:hypothetical protein ABTZ03_13910 [Kitasatospora sp. NPDC096077]|uniref:hypothetical protein n=1 Tax=Kitasatospora sp. NPDC096077 TaxID=3155544 RepID=UPI00331FB0E0